MIFKCKHKFSDLVVFSDSTEKDNTKHPKDYKDVTYHLYCTNCDTKLDLGYAKIKGGVSKFIKN
jgi:hypothetical protein